MDDEEVSVASVSVNGRAERCGFHLSVGAVSEDWEHRRDAYDTLGLATCVALGPSEKYHRRPACVPE